jgi:hypothetical protein
VLVEEIVKSLAAGVEVGGGTRCAKKISQENRNKNRNK